MTIRPPAGAGTCLGEWCVGALRSNSLASTSLGDGGRTWRPRLQPLCNGRAVWRGKRLAACNRHLGMQLRCGELVRKGGAA